MLSKEKHQLIMGRILKDIFTDISIAPFLGFKGGTCAYFFYGLPRFSVDLDFDLLTDDKTKGEYVFETLKTILSNYGQIKDSQMKLNTIFFLLSYGDADHNIKVEINNRTNIPALVDHFEVKEYLGISLLAAKRPYMFASKLAALTERHETAMRDIFDLWFFANNNWDIDEGVVRLRTGKSAKEYLTDCIALIESVKDNQILHGLGELVNDKQKNWIKTKLRSETVFLLKNYQSVLK